MKNKGIPSDCFNVGEWQQGERYEHVHGTAAICCIIVLQVILLPISFCTDGVRMFLCIQKVNTQCER